MNPFCPFSRPNKCLIFDGQVNLCSLELDVRYMVKWIQDYGGPRDKFLCPVFCQQLDEDVDEWCAALLTLPDKLTESPVDRQRLLQVGATVKTFHFAQLKLKTLTLKLSHVGVCVQARLHPHAH